MMGSVRRSVMGISKEITVSNSDEESNGSDGDSDGVSNRPCDGVSDVVRLSQ